MSEKSKVYWLKNFDNLETICLSLLKNIYPENSDIVIKIHFGEPGSKTALFASDVSPIINALKSFQLNPILVDTPVAYNSPRNNVAGYEKVAKERGYGELGEIKISDQWVEVKSKDFSAKVSKDLVEAKNLLVISHVKGHSCAGFGGAIKNFGMGGVMPETKNIEHDLSKPHYISECQGCGTCAELCPAGAITMVNNKAVFDKNTCYGCSICELSCPYKCLAPEKAYFDDLLAQGASAVINKLSGKSYYINIIKNVTKFCDCEVDSKEMISKDLGVLFSDNPVAIDKASVDLINEANGKNVFEVNNHKDPLMHVQFAAEYTGLKPDYELITS